MVIRAASANRNVTVTIPRKKFEELLSSLSSSHLFFKHEGRWYTTNDFATSFFHSSRFSTALWDLANSRPVHSLMLFSHLFLCLPCLLPPFIVPCKMILAGPERKTWPYHRCLRLFFCFCFSYSNSKHTYTQYTQIHQKPAHVVINSSQYVHLSLSLM